MLLTNLLPQFALYLSIGHVEMNRIMGQPLMTEFLLNAWQLHLVAQ